MNVADLPASPPSPPSPSSPSTAGTGAPPPRSPRRWVLFVPVLVVLAAGLLSAVWVVLPYYAIAPGSALSVEGLVEVTDAPSYESPGDIFLTTVSLRRVTAFEALLGWLDPSVDVLPEERILGDVDPAKFRQYNLQLMDSSKQTAMVVALRHLGYEVPERGDGAIVVQIVEGSPADGLLRPGDVIVAVDGEPVARSADATTRIAAHGPGDTVRLTVERAETPDSPPEELTARLVAHPDDPSRGMLGITVQTNNLQYDFPFDVQIASERIGGPSAGLAFTLEVLDVLTEGDLTGGTKVAATGTIGEGGVVGAVGGVAQKAVAVERAGVDVFLVPSSEEERARRYASDGLRIEPVDTLEEALAVLDDLGGNALAIGRPQEAGA